MQKFILSFFLSLFLFFTSSSAQQLPLFTQYAFDPYLVNPSMVAYSNKAEVNLLYRRQWAKIEDGPKTLQFDAQLPLNQRMAIGLNVFNDKTVLLSATSALVTFGYKIPLATDHTLGFGLSGGIFSNRIRIEDVPLVDASDPALSSSASNNIAMNGQFGMHYKFKDFMFGASFINLIERKSFTAETFQKTKFGQLKNAILFASYRFTLVPQTWFIQPNFAYRISQDNLKYFEASALLAYRNVIELGGGYRQDFGPTAMMRVHVKNLQVGFAYDLYSNNAQISPGGTQELQLKWRFGKNDEPSSKRLKKNSTPLANTEEKLQPKPEKEEDKPIKKEEIKPEPIIVEKKIEEKPTEQKNVPVQPVKVTPSQPVIVEKPQQKPTPVDQGMYFVVGTFENKLNAQQLLETAKRKGIVAEIKESKSGALPHYYYVHIPKYRTKEVSLEKVLELQKTSGFKDAWFTTIEE